jgi:hypothetical protein
VKVKVDDHIIVPTLDPAAVAADPNQAVEDYVASLLTLPMDPSRPLWEYHFLDLPTSEATSTMVIRVHHSLADGMSLLTLVFASGNSVADSKRPPAMPKQPKRTGAIYAPPRPSTAGALPFLRWVCSYFLLAWNTMVDVALFVATVVFLTDPDTLFKLSDDTAFNARRRFVHRSLSLDDVKFIKNAINCVSTTGYNIYCSTPSYSTTIYITANPHFLVHIGRPGYISNRPSVSRLVREFCKKSP